MTDNPESSPQEQPISAGERLRRIEAAARAAEEAAASQQEPGDLPELPDDYRGYEATQPVEPPETPAGLKSISGSIRDSFDIPHHPTGSPEQTGGWYSELPAEDYAEQTHPHIGEAPTRVIRPDQQSTRPAPQSSTAVPPPIGSIPQQPVSETDSQATRVTPIAYRQYQPVKKPTPPPASPPPARVPPIAKIPPRPRKNNSRKALGCLVRSVIMLLFLAVLLILVGATFGVYKYYSISRSLPSVADLRQRASQFETTRILDRNNNVIYEIIDPSAGKRTYVPLNKISPVVVAATLSTEDREFYNHPGFDIFAIARAFYQNYTNQEVVSGASTITQQLARILLLSPDERYEVTFERKTREIVLAAEITRQYSKDEILEIYLNEINYGNWSYGIEAAAETYFNTTADQLTAGQAAFLVGLPQSPSVYDIYTNREASLARYRDVLALTYENSQEKGCIYVSNSPDRVCMDETLVTQALIEIENYPFQQESNEIKYPHWVDYIRAQLESQFDPQTIYRSGFTVYTTLDPALQQQAEEMVKNQAAALAEQNVQDGSLIAIRPATGEILAMVGSADYYNDAISGQVNMALSPRQPGSSIKPLTFIAAFEKGWTASTLLWDVPTEYPASGDPNDPNRYYPVNYDGRFHGPVTVRSALANSYNIPAVSALQHIGVYDNPTTPQLDGLVPFAQRMGITSFTQPDYGLSLTLGGGEVSLLEMTGAFAALANNGQRVPPIAITRIVDARSNIVFEYQVPPAQQVVRPEHAYIISSILSDNNARTPMFGSNSVLNLPFQAAVKTGTTNDYRDNWTIGYTRDLAVGVWFGNADYTPMINSTGLTGAAPVWSQFMQYAVPLLTGGNPSPFIRPAGIVDRVICTISGTEPSAYCGQQASEIFAHDQLPLPADQDLWQKVRIDSWTGYRVSNACPNFAEDRLVLNVTNNFARTWIQGTDEGRAWAESIGFSGDEFFFTPTRECKDDDPRPELIFAGLNEGQTISTSPFDIYVIAYANGGFKRFRLEYGEGHDPASWDVLVDNLDTAYHNPERIYTWDLSKVPAGPVTLRLYMESDHDTHAEKVIHLNIQVPTSTPTPTPTSTQTPTITLMPTILPTQIPATVTPTPYLEPTWTVEPTPEKPTLEVTPNP